MSVRIVSKPYTSNVIALYPTDVTAYAVTNAAAEPSFADDPLPEPAMLYGLVVLAFLLHLPTQGTQRCVRCGTEWPCTHLRLAYRLREGF